MDIETTRAKSGMALNRDVIDRKGHVLLRSGVSLTERHLDLIRAHGIERIEIATDTPANPPRTRQPTQPDRLFRNQDLQHPLIQELLRVYQARCAHATEDQP